MKTFCQYLLLLINIASLFQILYVDVNGRAAKKPQGFGGIVTTILCVAVSFVLFYYAGAMSEIFK